MRAPKVLAAALLAAAGYLLFWPVPVDPVAWQAPDGADLAYPFAANDRLSPMQSISTGPHEGPEDIAPGIDGHLYATTGDGYVLRFDARGTFTEFAYAGPRPLGIEADRDGTLVVANAYTGLQRIGRDGSVSNILDSIGGDPLVFANDLAIASDGTIYFTESSKKFAARRDGGTWDATRLDLVEHGGHGRVIEFQPGSGRVRVIAAGLNYANGIAISEDQGFLLIAETGSYRILRHWLQGDRAGDTEALIENLPGFPDNINNGRSGRFWIGLVAPRVRLLDELSARPMLRKVLLRLPRAAQPDPVPTSHVIAIDGDGLVLMDLQDARARIPSLTGVFETRDALYLSSLFGNSIGLIYKADL